jgi:hypothetical protein
MRACRESRLIGVERLVVSAVERSRLKAATTLPQQLLSLPMSIHTAHTQDYQSAGLRRRSGAGDFFSWAVLAEVQNFLINCQQREREGLPGLFYPANFQFLNYLAGTVVFSLLWMIAINDRSALFTVSELVKYFLTSGSNITAPSASLKYCTEAVPSALWIITL